MTSRKRGTALTGDLFVVEHPTLDLSGPFTSHVDVSFEGVTHQVLSAADRGAFSYATTTGAFAIGALHGHVVETMDTVATQVTRRFQAILSSASGVLATQTYIDAAQAVRLIGELGPSPTTLGMAIDPQHAVEVTGAPRVAFTTPIGVLEVSPLTASIDAQLPTWRGTPVSGGDLYAGMLSDAVPYLTLVAGGAVQLDIQRPSLAAVMGVVNKGHLFHEPELLCGVPVRAAPVTVHTVDWVLRRGKRCVLFLRRRGYFLRRKTK